jgi:hypothetical protein
LSRMASALARRASASCGKLVEAALARIAAPGALVSGVVVMVGVRPTHTTARAAPGAGAAGAGV